VTDWRETFEGVRAVWSGEADVDDLDRLVAPNYRGHLGSRDRDLAQLKHDIVAYRAAAPNVEFRLEHQFGEGDCVATRWTASRNVETEAQESICGINISRWENGLLAEEWAVWESFSAGS
jgi:hypothetical protein